MGLFYFWLLSLSIFFLQFIHVLPCICISFLFMVLLYQMNVPYIVCPVIFWWTFGLSSCFVYCELCCISFYLNTRFPFCWACTIKNAGSDGNSVYHLEELPNCFPKQMPWNLHSHPICEGSSFSASSTTLIACPFYSSHLNGREVVSQCGFDFT